METPRNLQVEQQPAPVIQILQYPVIPVPQPQLWQDLREVGGPGQTCEAEPCRSGERHSGISSAVLAAKADAVEETRRSFERGREEGIRVGRELQRQEQLAAELDAKTEQAKHAADLVEQFAQQRDRFLEQAEHEVARLALAIAARILRREADIDPLFLTGAVRVALGQLAETTRVRLHLPAAEADLWKETLAHIPNLKIRPSVIADEHLHRGDCLIETELGSADLGIHAQLGEIARCLFSNSRQSSAQETQFNDSPAPGEPT